MIINIKSFAVIFISFIIISCTPSYPRLFKKHESTLSKNSKSKRITDRNLSSRIKTITDYSYSMYLPHLNKKPSEKHKVMFRYFDTEGNIIQKIYFRKDSIITYKSTFNYNHNGQIMDFQRFNENELEASRNYKYDKTQNCIGKKYYGRFVGWSELQKKIFPEKNMIQWDEKRNERLVHRTKYYYNNLEQNISTVYQNGILEDSFCYRYNKKGLKTNIKHYQLSRTFKIETRIKYDSNNNTTEIFKFNNNGEFIGGNKYFFNSNNDITRILKYSENSSVVETEELKYKYDSKNNWIYMERKDEEYRSRIIERKIEYY